MRTRNLNLLILGLLLSPPAQAIAADRAVIAVGACADGFTAAPVRALREALGLRPGQVTQTEEETASALGGLSRGSLADAERSIGSARFDIFDKNDLQRAERTLQTVLEDLWLLPPTDERWQDARTVRTMLASLYVKMNRKADAEDQLARILAVEPGYRPDLNLYPPSFLSLARRVSSAVGRTPSRRVSISTRPTGTPLFVDGRPVGPAPVVLKLPSGSHRIEAAFGGRRGIPRILAVASTDVSVEFDEGFDGAVYVDSGPCINTGADRESRLAAAARLGSLLGVREVIGVRTDEPSPGERYYIASVIDVAMGGQETREGKVKVFGAGPSPGALFRLAEFVATGEAADPVEAVSGAKKGQPGATPVTNPASTQPSALAGVSSVSLAPERSRTAAVLGWTAIGLGVAAGATAGYFAMSSGQHERAAKNLVSSSGNVPEDQVDVALGHRSTGMSDSMRGIAFGVAGGVLAAGGVAILLLPAGSPEEGPGALASLAGSF